MNLKLYHAIVWLIRLLSVTLLLTLCIGVLTVYLFKFYQSPDLVNSSDKDVTDLAYTSDFIIDDNVELVVKNCTSCHSSKLVTQNRASEEGWRNTILWMQKTQNLWDLGKDEDKSVAYLARNYAPVKQGRRKNIENVQWYKLEP